MSARQSRQTSNTLKAYIASITTGNYSMRNGGESLDVKILKDVALQ